MKPAQAEGRSREPITTMTLARLAGIAAADRERLYRLYPAYRSRLLGVFLCQGSALHFVQCLQKHHDPVGVKDFDVWSFFSAIPGETFPANRRNTHVDFGPSEFGRWEGEDRTFHGFLGRRVDLLMRALPVDEDADPAEAVVAWVSACKTKSARLLREQAIVVLEPSERVGEIIWSLDQSSPHG